MSLDKTDKIHRKLKSMRCSVLPDSKYFAITILGTPNGEITWKTQTIWSGYTEDHPPREIREACHVYGQKMLKLWQDVNTLGWVVNDVEALVIFFSLGGNAIVEDSLFRKYFPFVLEKLVTAPTGLLSNDNIKNIEPNAFKRAPTPKLRMKVLKRDGYKCRICGRSPEANVDIELHTHHFRPWAKGGLTQEQNLITLCHTCHKGLDPHFEYSLAEIFPETYQPFSEMTDDYESTFWQSVKQYRELRKKSL